MTTEIRKGDIVVGILDRSYVIEGDQVTFDDILVKGDLSGQIEYGGRTLEVERVYTMIGLEITMKGARGPVWKGVRCRVYPTEKA